MRDNGDPKPLPPQVRKGRGALSNRSGRFEAETREAFDDGWGSLDELPARVPTTLSVDAAKTVLSLEAAREKRSFQSAFHLSLTVLVRYWSPIHI